MRAGRGNLLGEDELKALGLGGADQAAVARAERAASQRRRRKEGSGDGSKSAYVVPARKEPSS